MRMIQHEPLDDAGAERGHFGIGDGNARAIFGGRQARHDNLAVFVMLVFELFDRALTAGAHRAQSRMPAEVWQLEPLRQTTVEQVLLRVHLAGFVVNVNGRHTYLQGQRCSLMCRSKSARKYFMDVSRGSAAPGASAQNVLPGLHILA